MPKEQEKELPYDAQDQDTLFDELFPVASTMECTGLIPAAPTSTAEVDSYSEIYDIPLSKNTDAAQNQIQHEEKTQKNSKEVGR